MSGGEPKSDFSSAITDNFSVAILWSERVVLVMQVEAHHQKTSSLPSGLRVSSAPCAGALSVSLPLVSSRTPTWKRRIETDKAPAQGALETRRPDGKLL